jgi:hypothetical protein
MTLFEYLLLAHLLGDWLLQTEWQAVHKRTSWAALITHVAIYHALVLAAFIYQEGTDRPIVYAAVAVLAVTHALLDRFTVVPLMRALRLVVKREPDRALMLGVDQAIHILLLGIAAFVVWKTRVAGM